MIGTKTIKTSLDNFIVLPAIVFFVSSIPWFAARFRMRALAPLMLLYFLITLARGAYRCKSSKENAAILGILIAFVLYCGFYLAMIYKYSGEFRYQCYVTRVFGLFYLWTYVCLFAEKKFREIKILTLVLLGALFITSVMAGTYLGDDMNMDAMRLKNSRSDNAELRDAALSGVGGFGTVYSIGLLSAGILYSSVQVKNIWLKCWMAVVSFAFFVYAIRATFSILVAALFLSYLFYVGSFFVRNHGLHMTLSFLSVMSVLFVTLQPTSLSFFAKPLMALAPYVQNPAYVRRLNSVVDVVSGKGGDLYALDRTGLMWVSWKCFLHNPLFGVKESDYAMGGHSFIFDYLGIGGLFFFSFFVICIYFYKRYLSVTIYAISKKSKVLIETYCLAVLFVMLLNPLETPIVYGSVFFLLPGLSLFFKDVNINKFPRIYGLPYR